MIPVQAISPNPRQPRTQINPEELSELAASIRENGIIQPLIVTRAAQPGAYILIAGERRLLAARQAGLETVPALIREATEQQRLELALIENVQRADLTPLEAAEAYRQLAEDFQPDPRSNRHAGGEKPGYSDQYPAPAETPGKHPDRPGPGI